MTTNVILMIIAFGMTIFLMNKNLNIGLIMLLNCIFIILGTGMDLHTSYQSVLDGLLGKKTISLITLLTLIMMIENIMRKTGMIKQMSENLPIYDKKYLFKCYNDARGSWASAISRRSKVFMPFG